MASYTTNLNLKKPAGSENVAIGDINNNMDIIDNAYGTLNSRFTHKAFEDTITTNTYGEAITSLSLNNVNAIIAIRATVSGNLVHTETTISSNGDLIVVVYDRTANNILTSTSVALRVVYI